MDENEKKGWEILAAAGRIEKLCLSLAGCGDCPLSQGSKCLVSDSVGAVLPVNWDSAALSERKGFAPAAVSAEKIARRCASGCEDCALLIRRGGSCAATGKPSGWNTWRARKAWRRKVNARRAAMGNALYAAASLLKRNCAESGGCEPCPLHGNEGAACGAKAACPKDWAI